MGSSEVKSTADFRTLEKIANEIRNRRRSGENTDLEQYVQQYPELADEIREALPALLLLDELAPSPASNIADTPDFLHEEIGEYQILKELGRGGMGIVFHAVQKSLGRPVALKILPHAALLDKNGKERFQREAQIAAMLHHTNIVPVFAIGDWRGVPYYAMQYIEGVTLDRLLPALRSLGEHIDAQGYPRPSLPLSDDPAVRAASFLLDGRLDAGETKGDSLKRSTLSTHKTESVYPSGASGIRPPYCAAVARLGVQIANALAHAHAHGVLHRDIKPSNLILGEDATLWVMDFGLAKQGAESDLTATGDLVGTLRYLAPERLRGCADERSDLYALGLTLYELLTFRPAFSDEDRGSLLARISRSDPVPLQSIHPWIPLDLVTIVTKAIAKEPERRYASAREISDDLIRFLEGRPVTARRTGALERTTRWCRRNPLIASLAASLFFALTAGLAGVTWQWRRAEANLTLSIAAQRSAELNLQEANSQRRRAEENLLRAQAAVDEYMTTISESTLLDIPTLEPLRRQLLERAGAYYRQFLVQHQDDPSLQAEIAAIHVRLANIIHETEGAGWLEEIKQALDILERLSEDDASFLQFDSWRRGVHNPRAGLLKTRDPVEALAVLQRGVPIWKRLATEHPDVPGFRSDLAGLHLVIGMLHRNRGQPQEALASFEAARTLRQELLNTDPSSGRFQYGLAECHAMVGLQRLDLKQLDQALASSSKARDLFLKVLQDAPGAARIENLLAATYQVIALEHLSKGNPLSALASFNQAIRIYEKLARDYPAVRDYQTQLGWNYQQLGQALYDAGAIPQGKEQFQKAIAHFAQRVRDYPEEPLFVRSLANAHLTFATRLQRKGEVDEAASEIDQAIGVYRHSPDGLSEDAAAGLARKGSLYYKARRFRDAQSAFTEALQEYGEPTQRTIDAVASAHYWLARTHQELAEYSDALCEMRQAIQAFGDSSKDMRRRIAEAHGRLGATMSACSDYRGATKEYTRAIELYRASGMAESEPVRDLLRRQSQLYCDAGRADAAAALFAMDRAYREEHCNSVFGNDWHVRFYRLSSDAELPMSVEDFPHADSPFSEITLDAIDFHGTMHHPAGSSALESFLIVAETEIDLDRADYTLNFVAEDDARVYVDNALGAELKQSRPGTLVRKALGEREGKIQLRIETVQQPGDCHFSLWLSR